MSKNIVFEDDTRDYKQYDQWLQNNWATTRGLIRR